MGTVDVASEHGPQPPLPGNGRVVALCGAGTAAIQRTVPRRWLIVGKHDIDVTWTASCVVPPPEWLVLTICAVDVVATANTRIIAGAGACLAPQATPVRGTILGRGMLSDSRTVALWSSSHANPKSPSLCLDLPACDRL